jgi:hypothetical protein
VNGEGERREREKGIALVAHLVSPVHGDRRKKGTRERRRGLFVWFCSWIEPSEQCVCFNRQEKGIF